MLSPAQWRIRERRRLELREALHHPLQGSHRAALRDSDTESEPIRASAMSTTSASTGKRVSLNERHLAELQASPTTLDVFGLRAVSPALESYLNSASDDNDESTGSDGHADPDVFLFDESEGTQVTSATVSDVLSSVSVRSSVSRRPSRKDYVSNSLLQSNIMAAMSAKCKCARRNGTSCHSSFNYGQICQLRFLRSQLDQTKERELRLSELKSAMSNPDGKISVGAMSHGIPPRMCCVSSYAIAYGLSKASIHRALRSLRSDQPVGSIGRAKKSVEDRIDDDIVGPNSPIALHAQAWLRSWVEEEADVDPVGNEQSYTIDLVEVNDVYKEYINEWRFNSFTLGEKVMSLRSFSRVWTFVMKEMRVRIREKKNMTTKCDGMLILISCNVM